MIVNLEIISWSNIMSVLSSDAKTNGFKLMRLIVDVGGEALRITLRKQLSGTDLFNVLNDRKNYCTLSSLKDKQIKQHQWDLLYPSPPILPNENTFDITLLCILLRNICGLKSPRAPIWENMPNVNDHSTEADITRIRLFRNGRFAHLPSTSVCSDDFENFWLEISEPLVRLGIRQEEIDRLKNEMFGKEECERILSEWDRLKSDLTDIKTEQRGIKKTVEGVEKDLQQVKDSVQNRLCVIESRQEEMKSNQKEIKRQIHSRPVEDILTNNLVSCNFESEIKHHFEKFLEGTREWVFDEFLDWFEDDSSQNRAFIISAVAGMEFCLKSLDNLKAEGVNYDVIKHASVRYSVKYWLLHLLAISDNECIVENVGKYLVDLEVLVASVLVNSRRTFENFEMFNAHDVYFHISEDIRLLFNEVYSVMTYSMPFDNEVNFLQRVANEIKDLSSQATTMLETRFKDSLYLERRDTGFVKARLLRLDQKLISVDVSRNHNYVVCGYNLFVVQLFSLRTNRCLWIKSIAGQLKQYKEIQCCVVFHPLEDLIFASQLDKDKYTMVTSYKDTLTVWDVEKDTDMTFIFIQYRVHV
ncbi:uncharacterized protein LOC124450590 [Xenia sp. Carnegie-2017]|uniref:uncharacterized protein LOC124450590 n=1 Tax=Xenia sp. Carnegie-2017 TaxID=2897299 RepID=UPI001F046EB5|nr:uncharacterized protein LOC124450590 [Xenia sp. Carnegie-2017]